MKTLELTDAAKPLVEYARSVADEPLILTADHKPVAALLLLDDVDEESLKLSTDPTFTRIIRAAARRVLEGCLHIFREADDVTNQAKALSALADLWDKRGDRVQAVALERQALAVRDRLPDLAGRSISHGTSTVRGRRRRRLGICWPRSSTQSSRTTSSF